MPEGELSTRRTEARSASGHGPDQRVIDKPVPRPGTGEALVKVARCGTCGTDLKIQAHPFPGQPPFGQFTPGHDWTGTIVALGETVDEFAIGDRVAIEAHKCSSSPGPPAGVTRSMEYRQDSDVRRRGHEEYGVGKVRQECTPNVAVDERKGLGEFRDIVQFLAQRDEKTLSDTRLVDSYQANASATSRSARRRIRRRCLKPFDAAERTHLPASSLR